MGKIIEVSPSINIDELFNKGSAGYTPDFRIFTAGIESDAKSPRLVHMIGSSTEKDMQGDTMSLQALNDMTKAAPNLTVWLNHDYTLPDSIFGSILQSPAILQRNGIADLQLHVDVELDNPAAARVKRYIDNGRRLGCSIGCMVTKFEIPESDDDEGWLRQAITIHGVYVVEYSVVGIPANQRSWVENAIRGVFTRTLDPGLAPAMKSLWPHAFHEIVSKVDKEGNRDRADVLRRAFSRPTPQVRLDWSPNTKMFALTQNGKQREITREEAAATLEKHLDIVPEKAITKDTDPFKDIAEWTPELEDLLTGRADVDLALGVCGSTSWPLDMDSSWDKSSAHAHLLEWAGGKENFNPAKFKRVHFRFENDGSKIGDYGFPFCDVKEGKVTAVWSAIVSAAGALGGARGGTNADSGDKAGIRRKVAAYYRKAGKTPPWNGDDGKAIAMDEDLVQKYAINEDGTQGVELTRAGKVVNHAPTSGTHTHTHDAYAHGDAAAHKHTHSHKKDNSHDHDHSAMNADPDNDGDIDTGGTDSDAKAGEPETTFALNADGSRGVEIYTEAAAGKANGPHEMTVGRHAHHHPAYGHGDVNDHHHMHDHHTDNSHHHDHSYMGDGEYTDDYDHDGVPDNMDTRDNPSRYSGDPEVTKEVEVTATDPEKPVIPLVIDKGILAQLSAYNAFGRILGLPEVTSEQLQLSQHPVVHKELAPAHLMQLQSIHDMASNMSEGAVCANYTSLPAAMADVQMAEGRDVTASIEAISGLGEQVRSLGDSLLTIKQFMLEKAEIESMGKRVDFLAKHLNEAESQVSKFIDTVASIKNMPLGNPVNHTRSVRAEDNAVSYDELLGIHASHSTPTRSTDSLKGALALTTVKEVALQNGSTISYRCWPDGVGGSVVRGCRPPLTANQIMYMDIREVGAYRNGNAANVPTIDDPSEK